MRQSQYSQIGIFDSGVGGLTVLKELYRQLPYESILYFADTARLPYGNRSQEEIVLFVREILTWMCERRVKMAIMACNTSSALALEAVRTEFDIPILGIVLPGARAAVKTGRRIGVIATPATVASNAYAQAIQEVNPLTQVRQIACPDFVPLIEQNRIRDLQTKQVALRYLAPLLIEKIDTLIYGCTHYPHLEPVLKEILPPRTIFVDPAKHVVAAAEQELEILGLKNTKPPLSTRFFVSGSPEAFARAAQPWIGYTPLIEKVHLPTVVTSPSTIFLETSE
jgi:glutamate racemase